MTERPARAPSIRDVARAAGVSHQTVSRVLNNAPSLRGETRDRVLAAMAELRYRPSAAARALSTSRSKTIGVLISVQAHWGPARSLQAIEETARRYEYAVASASVASSDPAETKDAIESLATRDIEYLIVIGPQHGVIEAVADLAPQVRVVTLRSTEAGMQDDAIAGARLATRHLIELGHVSIRHLSGPRDWIEADARTTGFVREMEAHGLPIAAPVQGDWTADFGYRAGLALLEDGEVTACFCSNDDTALGVLHAARDAGRPVPASFSVVGYDDLPAAAHFSPPLTTVRQDFAGVGRRCVEALLGDADAVDPEADLPPRLVVRSTTAPPPSAG